jgi:hypothetical protein
LDTIPTPLLLDQLYIIKYPITYTPSSRNIDHAVDVDDDDDDDVQYKYIDAHFRTKYIGAKVRVLTSPVNDHVGKEGTIINIVSMGDDWYITNNPHIDMALRASKFDIIKYANLPVICIDDDDDDDNNYAEVMTDMGKEKGMMKLSNNNDKQHQQQQQTQEEEMKTTIATAIAKAVVRNVKDKKRTLLSQSADGGGGSSFPVIPATPTSTTIVAATATTTITTVVDLNHLASSLSLDPPLSSMIDDYPIQQHHQSLVKDDNEEKGQAVLLPVTLDDTVASPVNVEEEEDIGDNTNSYLKETSAATKSIVMNEMAVAATATNLTLKKRRRKEVYSVKLPTFESIELASRFAAFDSFLFLVNDQQQQVTDSCSTTSLTSAALRQQRKTTGPFALRIIVIIVANVAIIDRLSCEQ